MKIAYIRFNNQIELDYMNSSVSTKGTDRRVGIFKSIISQGHKINIYSPLKRQESKSFTNCSLIPSNDPIIENTNYKFPDFPNDEDVLLIENATTNTLFSFKENDEQKPFIKRAFEIIDKWEGPVVYLQWDAELPFPFAESNNTPTPGVSDVNLTLMGSKIDMFKNKSWNVVTTILNTDKLIERTTGNRYGYPEYVDKITTIPLCYDRESDIRFYPCDNPKSTITYVGSESDNYRNEILSNFINRSDTTLYGKWSNKNIDKYLKNCNYKGVYSGHGNVYSLYNKSYVGVQCGERDWCELDHMTSRFFQILGGGSIPLLIDNYSENVKETYLGDHKELLTPNKQTFKMKITEIKEMSPSQRQEIINEILKHNKQWSDINWKEVLLR